MQLRTSIAKRVSKFNLDGMDGERDNRHGMPGQWTKLFGNGGAEQDKEG